MAFRVNFREVIYFRVFQYVTKVVLKVPAMIDHLFFLSLRFFHVRITRLYVI